MKMRNLIFLHVLRAVPDLSLCLFIVLFVGFKVIYQDISIEYGGRNTSNGSLLQGIFTLSSL